MYDDGYFHIERISQYMSYYEDFDYDKPASIKIWRKMVPFFTPYKKLVLGAICFMIVCAGVDILMPLMMKHAIDTFIEYRTSQGMWSFISVTAVVVIIQGLSVFAFVRLATRIELRVSRDIRQSVFNHLQTLSFSYYNVTPVGYMLARTMSDTARIGEIVAWGLVDFCWGFAYIVGVFIAMFILNWKLALIVMTSVPVIILLVLFFQKRILKTNRLVRKINSKMTSAMNEGITGARTTKTLVMEELNSGEFREVTGDLKKNATRLVMLRCVFGPLMGAVGGAAAAWVLGQGGHDVIFGGLLLGTMAAFINYTSWIFDPIQQIANVITEFISTTANVERVTGLLDREPDITDTPEVIEKYGDSFNPRRENWEPIVGDVVFDDVTFRYPDGKENVLEHFSLKVPAGTYVAIVGETGAGKSTLVNLVCRFFEPTGGRVLLDGRDLRERSQLWLHSSLGYVLQSPHLFSGTVRENIRYGRMDATDEEVEAAARLVSADKAIAKLEKGYDSDVGEGGDRLSTGEKQLISFARAVLADPSLFILDEATSSIDTETELLIQKAIAHLLKGRTSFVIAHRLSTIRTADIILVVKDGKIIEQGSHRSLLKKRGVYYDLYTRQFEEEVEAQVLA